MKTASHKVDLKHIEALRALGLDLSDLDNLYAIEETAHKYAEDRCNWLDIPEEMHDKNIERLTHQVRALFGGKLPKGFFINGDPRGHALKIDNDTVTIPEGIQTDWGGYGILCPEFEGGQ